MPTFLDPEVRRVLLEEIAHERTERGWYRALADDEANSYGLQFKARLRADGCNRAIRALRHVWTALVAVERRHAENAFAVDLSDWSPGELTEAWGR